MPPSSPDDLALLARIAAGQTEALEALYDRYNRLVFSVALAVLGDRLTAEEVTLDAFVRVWRAAASYRAERGKVSTWLAAITRHHAIDVLRRGHARRDDRTLHLEDLPAGRLDDPSAADPQQDAELAAQRRRVHAALAGLPPDQRQALALAFFQGYSHGQIAERLGQPLGTVKTRIRLAMQKLRQSLADDAPSDASGNG